MLDDFLFSVSFLLLLLFGSSFFEILLLRHWYPEIFFLIDFLTWTIFKVFIEFVTILLLFYVLVFWPCFIEFVTILLLFYVLVFWPRGMWDFSSPTRDRTQTPCIGRWSFNHWTAREVPDILNFKTFLLLICFISCFHLLCIFSPVF